MLGSIDANTGSPDLGWDTDQFPTDVKLATMVMKAVVEQGGLAPGGLNFDAKVRRESPDVEDMFIAHIGAMDTFARGLINAARIIEDGVMGRHLAVSFPSKHARGKLEITHYMELTEAISYLFFFSFFINYAQY
jgi:xylose isomerase